MSFGNGANWDGSTASAGLSTLTTGTIKFGVTFNGMPEIEISVPVGSARAVPEQIAGEWNLRADTANTYALYVPGPGPDGMVLFLHRDGNAVTGMSVTPQGAAKKPLKPHSYGANGYGPPEQVAPGLLVCNTKPTLVIM